MYTLGRLSESVVVAEAHDDLHPDFVSFDTHTFGDSDRPFPFGKS